MHASAYSTYICTSNILFVSVVVELHVQIESLMAQLLLIPRLLLQRESEMSQHRVIDKIQQLTEGYQRQMDTSMEEKVWHEINSSIQVM